MEEIVLKAELENLEKAHAFVERLLKNTGCSAEKKRALLVAVEELFVNVASYAYEGGLGNITIRARMELNPSALVMSFIDCGIPFNPLHRDDPDLSPSLETLRIGGRGIFIIKRSVDDMAYEYRDGQNVVTIRKFL